MLIALALVPLGTACSPPRTAGSRLDLARLAPARPTRTRSSRRTIPGASPRSGVRARYWDDGFSIWRKAPWLGVGADGYATARKPIQPDRLRVPPCARLRAADAGGPRSDRDGDQRGAARRVARRRDSRDRPASASALASTGDGRADRADDLATTAIAFGVHSAVDWTWFVPGTAITGLLCAAWVAGRGPLGRGAAQPLRRSHAAPRAGAPRAAASRWPCSCSRSGSPAHGRSGSRSGLSNKSDAAPATLLDGHPQQALADAQGRRRITRRRSTRGRTLAAATRQPAAGRRASDAAARRAPAAGEPGDGAAPRPVRAQHRRSAARADRWSGDRPRSRGPRRETTDARGAAGRRIAARRQGPLTALRTPRAASARPEASSPGS